MAITVKGKLVPLLIQKHMLCYTSIGKRSVAFHIHIPPMPQPGRNRKEIFPSYGTTHADHNTVDIPCAPPMTDEMIKGDYEYETGFQIMNCFKEKGLSYEEVEMILVGNHAPFTWGKNAEKAVYNSAVLESIAQMALLTEQINPKASRLKDALIKKHFQRKHGPDSYYGQ